MSVRSFAGPAALGATALLLFAPGAAHAAGVPGDADFLDSADQYSVIAGSTVTNTGPSVLSGGLAVSPGTALTGFPPGLVAGAVHSADAEAAQAQLDITTAAGALLAVPSYDIGSADLDGLEFGAGAYSSASSLLNRGTITLVGDADDVFIFTAVSSLTTGAGSTVLLTGGVQECNVYWRVGSSAALGAGSHLVGTVVAQASVTATTGATIAGRLFAQTAAVTLQSNVFTAPACDTSGGDGSAYGPDGAEPDAEGPSPSPGGPTGPVLEVPDGGDGPGAEPGDGAPGSVPVLAATGGFGTPTSAIAGSVLAGSVLVGLGAGALAWRRGRRHLAHRDDRGELDGL